MIKLKAIDKRLEMLEENGVNVLIPRKLLEALCDSISFDPTLIDTLNHSTGLLPEISSVLSSLVFVIEDLSTKEIKL